MADIERLRQQAARAWSKGAWPEAEQRLRKALKSQPRDADLIRLLALCRHRQGHGSEACDLLHRALKLAPSNAQVLMNLGSVQAAMGHIAEALQSLQRACELDPSRAAAWYNLGKLLKAEADETKAIMAMERAVKLDPSHVSAHAVLGDLRKALGDAGQAENAYRDALALQPNSGHAWWGLANLKVTRFGRMDVTAMEAALRSNALTVDHRVQILFALARAYEQLGDMQHAFDTTCKANALQRSRVVWDRAQFSRVVGDTIDRFPVAQGNPDAQAGSNVIFITSLPRAGSTLVEQVLAAHPDVNAASELPDLPAVIEAEGRRRGRPFPLWVADAEPADWQRLGAEYLQRTARWQRPGKRFTDKWPNNFLHVGAIRAMLPGAHVVACDRDPLDTCWSCFQQYFARGQFFSYDLDDLVQYYLDYRRLDAHWRHRFPECYSQVQYETLVTQPTAVIPGLLETLGLEPESACLQPHLARRAVRTASAAQVREPLDKRGIGRWKIFAEQLRPWREALGPVGTDTPRADD